MPKYVYIVCWIDDGTFNAEVFETRADAETFKAQCRPHAWIRDAVLRGVYLP